MVGDRQIDIAAAAAVGCTPIAVTTGLMKYEDRGDARGARPAFVASNLQEAANWILRQQFNRRKAQDDEL
jgi:phosphoglycolate phosphatase-like HAD superfamily hydrolase